MSADGKVINLDLPDNLSVEQALGYAIRRRDELSNVLIMGETKSGHYVAFRGGEMSQSEKLWLLEVERTQVMNRAFDRGAGQDAES
jgi:hypothetical protein